MSENNLNIETIKLSEFTKSLLSNGLPENPEFEMIRKETQNRVKNKIIVENDIPKIDLSNNIEKIENYDFNVYSLTNTTEPDTIIIYIHGGSFAYTINPLHLLFGDQIVSNTNSKIYFPLYGLVPYTYEDAYPFFIEVYKNALKEDKKIILMGDSVGGGLALGLMEYIKELNLKQPDKLILISPLVNLNPTEEQITLYKEIDPNYADFEECMAYKELWVGDSDINNYKLSPVNGDLSNLPITYIFVGMKESLYYEITDIFNIMKDKGNDVHLIYGEGMTHCFPLLIELQEPQEALKIIIDIINND